MIFQDIHDFPEFGIDSFLRLYVFHTSFSFFFVVHTSNVRYIAFISKINFFPCKKLSGKNLHLFKKNSYTLVL